MNRPRILLIGPTLPFRGGIAQHTTMLHRALTEACSVRTLSFFRQYPAWLFPGESDRDPAFVGHEEPGVEYLLDSINPLTWNSVVTEARSYQPDLIVIPWWTAYWAPCFSFLGSRLTKAGLKVAFFCHNVIEHEDTGWKKKLMQWTLRNGSCFMVHNKEDASNLLKVFPNAEVAVHPHPLYDQFPEPGPGLTRRAGLELLFFGFVRPYKGLDNLIEAMALLENKQHIRLTVAGEFWAGLEQTRERIRELGLQEQIELLPRYLPEQEVADLFGRADVVVLPYLSASGSGVVPLAYYYGKPVIVTKVQGLTETVEDGKTGWVVEENTPTGLASTIDHAYGADRASMPAEISRVGKQLSWESMGKVLVDWATELRSTRI